MPEERAYRASGILSGQEIRKIWSAGAGITNNLIIVPHAARDLYTGRRIPFLTGEGGGGMANMVIYMTIARYATSDPSDLALITYFRISAVPVVGTFAIRSRDARGISRRVCPATCFLSIIHIAVYRGNFPAVKETP